MKSNVERGKYPIDRPCSACGDGDYKMKYHDHDAPFRKGYGPESQPGGAFEQLRQIGAALGLDEETHGCDDLVEEVQRLKRMAEGQPAPEMDLERMAEAVHEAYLETCARLGWEVKAANRVPYAELSEDSKELDRASVRAVLRAHDARVQPSSVAGTERQESAIAAISLRVGSLALLDTIRQRDKLKAALKQIVETVYDVLPENLGTAMDKITELAESALKESSRGK